LKYLKLEMLRKLWLDEQLNLFELYVDDLLRILPLLLPDGEGERIRRTTIGKKREGKESEKA